MRKISLLIFICIFSAIAAHAQTERGALYAADKKGVRLGACPLKHTSVKTEISGFLARVTVVQEFENKFAQPIEAVYTFPLSDKSAVDAMTMRVGARTIRGKIMKREEARQVYDAAKTAGKTASLLDQERANIFTQSVANILPNEKITVEISYVETLKYEDGAYEFVFPMTIAPRYIPASVKDASKISPPIAKTRAGHDISIEINLNAGVPVEEIRSGSHEIETMNAGAGNANIKLKNQNTIPNKDFVLRYDVTGKRIEDAILTHGEEGRGGFFSMILSPPDRFTSEDVTPKEIVFVLDTSGSMSGFPIEKAKEAMRLSLENLYPNDTFNLITFAGDTAVLFDEPVPATQANIERAKAFLESRSGAGGTEMMTAIKAALEASDAATHVRIVCFMTDGVVGNDAEIIAEVRKHPNARVFSFGIGQSVNRFLLDKIAEEGRGEAEFVALEDDGSKAAKRFYERVRTPLLTDVSIDWNGLPVADVYPNRISDLFSAKPVVLHGRYLKAASGTIKLKGKVAGQDFVREIAVNFPETDARNDVLATLWARQRIDDLTKQDYDGVQNRNAAPDVQNTITNIGLEYRLLTQFTSFVAVEEKVVNQNGKPTVVEVPVEFPEGMNRETTLGEDEELIGVANQQGLVSTYSNSIRSLPVNGRRNTVSLSKQKGKPSSSRTLSGGGGGIGYGIGSGSGRGMSGSSAPPPPPAPPKVISGGVLNGKATNLPKPEYPAAARAVRANGTVSVQVTIDESGNVISASAVAGHPLLKSAAEQAARMSSFTPTLLSGKFVKVTGVIVYNFANPEKSADVNVSVGEVRPQTVEEKTPTQISPETLKRQNLAEKFHFWIFALVERLQKVSGAATTNEAKFVSGGKADVQIKLTQRTAEALEKLKTLGFETVDGKNGKTITGRIAVEKLAALTEISEVRYVLPKIK